jgi:toluene monooxygenase system protein D
VNESEVRRLGVGPVLQSTPLARAVVTAIEHENEHVVVADEGAYVRVLAPRVCRLTRARLETETGHPVQLPGDLEVIMSSFSGLIRMDEEGAVWWLAGERAPGR